MGYGYGPKIITDGLILHLDAGNRRSYSGSGTNIVDLSTNANNGTINGGVTYTTSGSGAFLFDGSTGYITTPNTTVYQNVTLSVWFNSGITATSTRALISKNSYFANSTTDFPIAIYRNISDIFCALSYGNDFSYDASLTTSVQDNTWNNVVVTFNQSTLNMYLNNVKTSTAANFSLSNNSQPWTIGRAPQEVAGGIGQTSYQDKISVVSIYNRAITDDEVSQNFNALRGRYGI